MSTDRKNIQMEDENHHGLNILQKVSVYGAVPQYDYSEC
jgi:hypothetical protein